MLYLIVEPHSAELVGVAETLCFLNEQARLRRSPMCQVTALKEIPAPNTSGDSDVIFLLGLSESWVLGTLQQAYHRGIFPVVLSNFCPRALPVPCGLVAQDMEASMRQSVEYLRAIGCSRIALYGVNPVSTGDRWRQQAFLKLGFPRTAIFTLQDTLLATYLSFAEQQDNFDGVICVYDHTAVSLLRYLCAAPNEPLTRLAVLSFGDARISALVRPSLTTIAHSRREVANAAFLLYELYQRCPSAASVNILLKSQLCLRQSTKHLPWQGAWLPTAQETDTPDEIMRVEKILVQCDETDHRIMDCLVEDMTIPRICESCYLSETPVKRRLRRLEQRGGVTSRTALKQLLQKYFGTGYKVYQGNVDCSKMLGHSAKNTGSKP